MDACTLCISPSSQSARPGAVAEESSRKSSVAEVSNAEVKC
jgi:hypothetical protein